jgi:hypothetical protein
MLEKLSGTFSAGQSPPPSTIPVSATSPNLWFYSHLSLGGSQFDLWSLDGVNDCFVYSQFASVFGDDAARQRQCVNVKDDKNMTYEQWWREEAGWQFAGSFGVNLINIVTGSDIQTDSALAAGACPCILAKLLLHSQMKIVKETTWTVSNNACNAIQIQALITNNITFICWRTCWAKVTSNAKRK